MSIKKTPKKKSDGMVRISKKDSEKLVGKTKWALLAEEQKRDRSSQ